MQESPLISVGTAARILDESPSTTLRRVHLEQLPYEKIDGSGDKRPTYLVLRVDVERLAAERIAQREAKVQTAKAAMKRTKKRTAQPTEVAS